MLLIPLTRRSFHDFLFILWVLTDCSFLDMIDLKVGLNGLVIFGKIAWFFF